MDNSGDPGISAPISAEPLEAFRARLNANRTNGNGNEAPSPSLPQNGKLGSGDADSDGDYTRNWHYNQSISMVTKAKGSLPNTPFAASVISAALGGLLATGLFAAATPLLSLSGLSEVGWARPQLGVYLAAMGLFHLLEFWTTAGWNYHKLSIDCELWMCCHS